MASAQAPIVAFIILSLGGLGVLAIVAATRESAPPPKKSVSAPGDPLAEPPAEEPTPTPKTPTGPAATDPATSPAVRDVIAKNRSRFKACFEKTLAADPKAKGTVRVTVKLGPTGDVVSSIGESDDAPPAMTSCIVNAFKTMKFPPPEGGSATFVMPISLKAG